MKNNIFIFISFIITILFSGCAQKQPYDYSSFLQNKPKSILVVMPTNETVEVKGPTATLANSIMPLSEAGYYVFPPAVVNETFKQNGIYDAKQINNLPLSKLKEIFNADSILYLNVKNYGNKYVLLSSSTEIEVEAKLVDLNTEKTLWNKSTKYVDSSSDGGGNLIAMLVTAVVSQIAKETMDQAYKTSAIADSILFSTDCNDCILHGPYSPNFDKDKQLQ